MEPISGNEHRQQMRTHGYSKAMNACNHCRRREIRCIVDPADTQGRCSNCIRLKKMCSLISKARRDRKERVISKEEPYKQAWEIATESVVNSESHFRTGGDRGRTPVRDRATSPNHYSENERTRSQSPAHSFYHGDSPARMASPIGSASHGFQSNPHVFYGESSMPSNQDPWITPIEWMRTFPDSTKMSDSTKTSDSTKIPNFSHLHDHSDRTTRPDRLDIPGNCLLDPPVGYQYTPLLENEVRLLRIDPDSFENPLVCSLKVIPMERIITVVHEFQALSYAWGDDTLSHEVFLCDLPKTGECSPATASNVLKPYAIRRNLYQALKYIRLIDDHLWIWVDALCIDQANNHEKTQQLPKMLGIYSCAWNVIAWLGDDESLQGSAEEAVSLVPDILNLKTLDIDLRGETPDENVLRSWASFGNLLQQPWFERRWVIQEVACARKLSVRVADKILSWLDFADAIDLYSANIDRIQLLYQQSALFKLQPALFDGVKSEKAVALMQFSRNVFQRSSSSTIASRLMTLESLVLTASPFVVSEVHDTVYALLNLANDMHDVTDTSSDSGRQHVMTSDYSKHPVDIFKEFVRYSIAKSNSLDVLYRVWASWPQPSIYMRYHGRLIPSWIGVAMAVPRGFPHIRRTLQSEDLLGPVGFPVYRASHLVALKGQVMPSTLNDIFQLDGMVLGTVETLSDPGFNLGLFGNDTLKMLGWRGTVNEDIHDQLWRTLVANRGPDSKVAPTWYRRACALALTQLNSSGVLDLPALIADSSQPSTLVDYLKRVQKATCKHTVFRCKRPKPRVGLTPAQNGALEAIVGLGPLSMSRLCPKIVCILYGSSVPVILGVVDDYRSKKDTTLHVKLIGPCYAHGHMEGEIFAGMSEMEIKNRTTTFSLR